MVLNIISVENVLSVIRSPSVVFPRISVVGIFCCRI
jgi:hypothetical protein